MQTLKLNKFQTQVLDGNLKKTQHLAIDLLKKGELVAVPTETVYGLSANAYDENAVAKIFAAKERPKFDPLIVHLPTKDFLPEVCDLNFYSEELQAIITKITNEFWPGGLTLILRKKPRIPEIVTSGLDFVAVRISENKIFNQICRNLKKPLAAPSANRFGKISPTDAQAVLQELNGKIPLIVNGGNCKYGLESTIINFTGEISSGKAVGQVLRNGTVEPLKLQKFVQFVKKSKLINNQKKIKSPGNLKSHYSPTSKFLPLRYFYQIIENKNSTILTKKKVALLCFQYAPLKNSSKLLTKNTFAHICELAPEKSQSPPLLTLTNGLETNSEIEPTETSQISQILQTAAQNLFRCMRQLDDMEFDYIFYEEVPENLLNKKDELTKTGLAIAIADRLAKASYEHESEFNKIKG